MSFVNLLQNASKYQLLEIAKDGISYLLVLNGKEAMRAVSRFRESGAISLKEGVILWQGEGAVPKILDEALTSVGLGKNAKADNA